MSGEEQHYTVAQRIITLLKTQSFEHFQPEDVQLIDLPLTDEQKSTKGIYVGMLEEQEGVGLNDLDDWRYRYVVARILHKISRGQQFRSQFRVTVRNLFHNTRITVPSTCEILTTVAPGQMKLDLKYKQMDISQMIVRVLVRETRGS
jgi:hypothetical protein